MRVQRIAAIVLVAMFGVWLMSFLVGDLLERSRSQALIYWSAPWVPRLQVGLALTLALTAAVGLALSWWWARMLSISLALALLYPVVISAADPAVDLDVSQLHPLQIAWAVALLACLRGPAFLALHEGRQAGMDWRARGMGALWWAIVLNGVTLMLLPLHLIGAWQHWADCFQTHYPTINQQASAYWPSVVLAVLLLVSLGLLAWQKTAGLLLTAVVSVVFPLVIMATLRRPFSAPDARQVLLIPVPGLLAAWLALGLWAKPTWRLLRS
jgi:hypothetical protein